MTVSLSPIGNAAQFFSAGGQPLNGGQLFTYAAGSSTPQATYTDSGGATPNGNPIVLAADGRLPAEVWLTDGLAYKFVLKDSLSNLIGSYDNIGGMVSANSSLIAGTPIYVPAVGGTGNVLTLTPTNPITAYAAGQIFTFSMAGITSNTGNAIVSVSGLPSQVIYSASGLPLTGYELRTSGVYMIEYSSALSGFVLINTSQPTQIVPFTPSIAFGGSSVGITYAFRSAAYYKQGNVVHYAIDLQLSSKGAAAGIATIEGLPFTVSSAFPTGSASVVPIVARFVTFAGGYLSAIVGANGTSMTLLNVVSAGSYVPLSNVEFANNTEILVTGSYPI